MKKELLALFTFLCFSVYAQHPSTDSRWQLVFEDEFDSTAINTDKWNPNQTVSNQLEYDVTTNHCLITTPLKPFTYNYSPNPDIVSDTLGTGSAKIYVRYHSTPVDGYYWCEDRTGPSVNYIHDTIPTYYTKGALTTHELFLNGYFEIKFMMPYDSTNNGKNYNVFGPNFWLFGQTNTLKSEIDIYENNHMGNTIRYTNAVHWWEEPTPYHTDFYPLYGFQTGVWHTAGCNWTREKVDFFLDGELTRSITENMADSLTAMFIIIDINTPSLPSDNTLPVIDIDSAIVEYPYVYYIDYVKIWQLQQDCATDISFCNSAPTTAANNVQTYQTITTGGAGCNTIFSDYVSLKGTDYIILDENTVIPTPATGGVQIFEVDGCMDY